MRLHPLIVLLKWALSLGLVAGLLAGLYLVHEAVRAERAREEGEEKVTSKQRVKDGKVELEEDEAQRYGLEAEPARAVQWSERIRVYGRVVPNPRATAEVRSPFAGTLRALPGSPWPQPGRLVRAGQVLGRVDVRLGPEVRLDLENKLAEARARERGAEEEARLQQGRVDSLKKVTSQEIIGRMELDAALVQLAQARTQASTARAAAALWQKALDEVKGRRGKDSAWSQPLDAPADGEVTELAGRPGMAIEAGGLVVQLVDFSRPLVRLDVPPELLPAGPPQQVELFATPAARPLLATLAGPAPQVDVASQFAGYWYEVRKLPGSGNAPWRPGLQVQAHLSPRGARAQPAVSVPADAVLYHEGRALVYVRLKDDLYQRREVRLLGRDGERWVVARREGSGPTGVAPGETVVSRHAQVLLSEEFKPRGEAKPEGGADKH